MDAHLKQFESRVYKNIVEEINKVILKTNNKEAYFKIKEILNAVSEEIHAQYLAIEHLEKEIEKMHK